MPALKRQNEELKIAQTELADELEVIKVQKTKVERRLDSLEQGLINVASTGQAQAGSGTINGRLPLGREQAEATGSATRYVVVVGSFRSEVLANQYVQRLKKAGVTCSTTEGGNGFVRVYTGPYTNEQKAFEVLDKVRVETPAAWLLRL
jgi:hypothetical protein